jgi:hypothetical protein
MRELQPHPNLAICIALFCAAQSFIVASAFILFAMIGKANRHLPDDQQISSLGFHPFSNKRIFREYRRFHPQGHLVLYYHLSAYTGVALLFAFGYQFFS